MANRYYLRHIQLAPGVALTQVTDHSIPTNTEYLVNFASGAPYPGHVSIAKQRPLITAGTEQIGTVLALCGMKLANLSANPVTAYYQRAQNLAGRVAGASGGHRGVQLNNCGMWWDSLTARAGDTAVKMSVNIEPTYDGSAVPMVALGSLAFTPNAAVLEKYCLGKVVINGTTIDEVEETDIQLNHTLKRGEQGGTGVVWNPHLSLQNSAPRLMVRSPRFEDWGDLVNLATAIGVNGVNIYLRRKENDRRFYADNVAQHIKIQALTGVIGPEDLRGGGADPATGTLSIPLRSAGGDVQPLAITVGTVIP